MIKAGPLVSIVVPVYNAESFLANTIDSVRAQTYNNWELLLVDDCSSDASVRQIKDYRKEDARIKLIRMDRNSGAALSRNIGIEKAKGKYLAFLDADDAWLPSKLEKQIRLASERNAHLVYSGYEFANADGQSTGKTVKVPASMSLKQAYGNHLIWTSTVLINLSTVHKSDIKMLDISFGEDITTWWRILAKYGSAYGITESLALYRRGTRTLSSNKWSVLLKKWRAFKYAENFNQFKRPYYYLVSLTNAARKRL